MQKVIEQIKQIIAECASNGEMFRLPIINRTDIQIKETDLEPTGSCLYRCEYKIDFDNGDWILIEYVSKDKCRTFKINPDRSVVEVTCSDPKLNFTDGWDESV